MDTIKGSLLNRLARGQSIRFSDNLEAEYFNQLCSERRVTRYVRGQPVRRFERISGRRAEALDCCVYAFAAYSGMPKMADVRENALREIAVPTQKATVQSKWLART